MYATEDRRKSAIRHSIVASIPACHAGDRGSIPRDGDFYHPARIRKILSLQRSHIVAKYYDQEDIFLIIFLTFLDL